LWRGLDPQARAEFLESCHHAPEARSAGERH
jgi:hypothetical protein